MSNKKCRVCEEIKSFDKFSKRTSSKDGFMNICKICDSAKACKWHYNNPDKSKLRAKKSREQNIDYVLQKDKERYYNNKEAILKQRKEYYENNRDIVIERVGKWIKNNQDKVKIYRKNNYEKQKPFYLAKTAKRKAKKLNATPLWLNEIHHMQIQWYYAAAKMMSETTGILHHVDHIHPIQGNGFTGLHVPWNLRVIKAEENLSKGNKIPAELLHLMWEPN
jgi:5-methylcytosine-specific restriction endonuclease McrA